jgi:hypothetical protein
VAREENATSFAGGRTRDIFERFGEAVIETVLAGNIQPRAPELAKLYADTGPTLRSAAAWLTERGDSQEQREQRMETVEWVLVFVVLGVMVESVHLFRSLVF